MTKSLSAVLENKDFEVLQQTGVYAELSTQLGYQVSRDTLANYYSEARQLLVPTIRSQMDVLANVERRPELMRVLALVYHANDNNAEARYWMRQAAKRLGAAASISVEYLDGNARANTIISSGSPELGFGDKEKASYRRNVQELQTIQFVKVEGEDDPALEWYAGLALHLPTLDKQPNRVVLDQIRQLMAAPITTSYNTIDDDKDLKEFRRAVTGFVEQRFPLTFDRHTVDTSKVATEEFNSEAYKSAIAGRASGQNIDLFSPSTTTETILSFPRAVISMLPRSKRLTWPCICPILSCRCSCC